MDEEEVVDLKGFLELLAKFPNGDDVVEEAFGYFDESERGFITKEDLMRVAQELGEKFSDGDFDGMLKLAENEEGIVTKESFVKFLRSIGI